MNDVSSILNIYKLILQKNALLKTNEPEKWHEWVKWREIVSNRIKQIIQIIDKEAETPFITAIFMVILTR